LQHARGDAAAAAVQRASFSAVKTLKGRTDMSTRVTVSLKILVPKRSLCALRREGAASC
jgi:hypothetical protein